MLSFVKSALIIIPSSLGFSLVKALASKTQRPRVLPNEADAIARATKVSFKESSISGWTWGTGKLVVLVHGWSGRASQLAPLAEHISKQGFKTVVFDVSGNGNSEGKHTNWRLFFDDVAIVSKELGEPVYAYVAHSAGALSVMAARKIKGVTAEKYVCICAPSHPFPPLVLIKKLLNPREAVVNLYRKFLADQFETTWDALESGVSFVNAGPETFFIYDSTDKFVPHTEGDKLLKFCIGAKLLKTNSYSHLKILTAPEIEKAVSDFLK